jgi:hypothetical protein
MYYFYIIVSVGGRIGFGICQDYFKRNHDYVSHSGDIVDFVYLFGGIRNHSKSLEKTVKQDWADKVWRIDDWETEWLEKTVTLEEFYQYISQILKERPFLKLKLIAQNYNCTQGQLD